MSDPTWEYFSKMAPINPDVRSDLDWIADVQRTRHCLCDEFTADCPK